MNLDPWVRGKIKAYHEDQGGAVNILGSDEAAKMLEGIETAERGGRLLTYEKTKLG